jgi:hypothetical protein
MLKSTRIVSLALLCFCLELRSGDAAEAVVRWLGDQPPAATSGVSFGVPWPEGAVQPAEVVTLRNGEDRVAAQTWPLAYWPDGSIKWTAVATVLGPEAPAELQVVAGAEAQPSPASGVRVEAGADAIRVTTSRLTAVVPTSGADLLQSISIGDREIARRGRLQLIAQDGPDQDRLQPAKRTQYDSHVQRVTVEQDGPVRAVLKIEGVHQAADGERSWLPFVVRLYFYEGDAPIQMVHTIIYDGDKSRDLIAGLGVAFDVPLRAAAENRHVRFANSNGGLWAEPVLLPFGRGGFGGGRRGGNAAGTAQPGSAEHLDGRPVEPTRSELAQWDAFKLVQPNSDGFTIVKRTNPDSAWIDAGVGQRASGLAFVGDVEGSLAVAVKNFWQSYPASLEITGATSDAATLNVWLWSPDGPAMDMRHYDTRGHGPVNGGSGSYEDYEAEFATPEGVARTSELSIFVTDGTPTRAATVDQSRTASARPLLVTTSQYLHNTGIFGPWAVQDRSTEFRRAIEDRLDFLVDYYRQAIDEHRWYGFWHYGDVRHAYDERRHAWRYDIGGYAWDNTELGSVLWLWYSYVRTGRADIFRMAEAMTRHCSEVDVHHLGRFAGLGSRHNVIHWGDSAKEARVSQAAHNRFMYYLTTDERIGDLMREVVNVDKVAAELDPMRKAQPKSPAEAKYPGRIRVGPDWLAFVSNWMTEWERTGDAQWRDKIMAGVNSMAEMPYGMRTGRNLVMGYDPATGKLYQVDDQPGSYNLPTIQGGAEVAFELTDLLDEPAWTKMWLQYCRLGNADAESLRRDMETGSEGADASLVGEQGGGRSQGTPRLAAYLYQATRNAAFAEVAMRAFSRGGLSPYTERKIDAGPESLNAVTEARGVSTNTAAQASLMAIEILELLKDRLPEEAPAVEPPRFGRGR